MPKLKMAGQEPSEEKAPGQKATDQMAVELKSPEPQPVQASPRAEIINVGPDKLTITAQQVTIDAAHEMPDWEVREFSPIPIYLGDEKYFLRQRAPGERPYAMRYILEPWPDNRTTSATGWLTYDEETVAQRESAITKGRFEDVARAFLILFYPFLGLLWSGTKDKLARMGFVPRNLTGISIMLCFGVVLLDGVFAKMLLMGSMKTGTVAVGGIIRSFYGQDFFSLGALQIPVLWVDVALFVALVLDVLVRYSQHLREADSPWGFLEWLVPRKKAQPTTA